ncbi:hypothetical protein BKA61DRAFT_671771 [Leptodontidium sp. MPI-SDFR-AT-0119]|nr:hypothetical protein BKA61DRAFT_671771 [Leptodontidium sp. MPI-SDFR-AT-0119]
MIPVCDNLHRFTQTLVDIPGRAALIRSFTINADWNNNEEENEIAKRELRNVFQFLSRIESFQVEGVSNIRGLFSYENFEDRLEFPALKELKLPTFNIAFADALTIFQNPRIENLSIKSIISEPPVGTFLGFKRVRAVGGEPYSSSRLKRLELGRDARNNQRIKSLLEHCRSLQYLKWIVSPIHDSEPDLLRWLLWGSPYPLESLPNFLDLKSLKSLDVSKIYFFRDDDNHLGHQVDIDVRDGLYQRLPKSLEILTIDFPYYSSVVDSQFTWAADQDLVENCTWIEELALYKPSHLPKLSHVNIYEAGDVEQTKSWNIPGTLSRLYKTRKIELEVTVRRLLEYQPSAEPEYWEDRWEYRFTPCAARDPNVLNDIWFTLPEVIPDSTEDARVEAALKAYSSKMRTDNRLFLAERTKEIKAMKLPTPRDEAPFVSYGILLQQQQVSGTLAIGRSVEEVEDVLSFTHPLENGIEPGKSNYTQPWDMAQIEFMEAYINRRAGLRFLGPLRLNDEFISFVKYASRGVKDPDFRKSGICEFYPRWGPSTWEDPQDRWKDPQDRSRWNWKRDGGGMHYFHFAGQRVHVLSQCFAGSTLWSRDGLVAADTGRLWSSYYILCKKGGTESAVDISSSKEQYTQANGWHWRVLFVDGSKDPQNSEFTLHLFDSIVEFLQWYDSWYDRLDMGRVREDSEPN